MTGAQIPSKPAIWIRVDAKGQWPLMLSDGQEMPCGNGVEWRFVAVVESREQGRVLLEQLQREGEAQAAMRAGSLPAASGARGRGEPIP